MSRRYGEPILVPSSGGGSTIRPRRLPLTEKKIDEGWLQRLIADHPEILPVSEIEPAFSPLVTVGIEIATDVGNIDNLYMSPSGYVTLVETKLWRNPEARREVVGQIIDYAKELTGWTFNRLDEAARNAQRTAGKSELGIIETLRTLEHFEESEEAELVDAISRNLQRGRMLLLIVGDGIRESVEAMANYLSQSPQLMFTLALVELELHEIDLTDDGYLMVIPHVVARTREVTRAVVRVEGRPEALRIDVDTPPDTEEARKRTTLTEEDYFDALSRKVNDEDVAFARDVIDDMQKRGFVITWAGASFVVKLSDPAGSGRLLTFFVVTKDGRAYIGWLANQLENLGLPDGIAERFASESADLFEGMTVQAKYPDYWKGTISISQLRKRYQAFAELVERTAEEITTASREVSGDRG